eukprot:PhM_4_TR11179/c0_g4_i1/m.53999
MSLFTSNITMPSSSSSSPFFFSNASDLFENAIPTAKAVQLSRLHLVAMPRPDSVAVCFALFGLVVGTVLAHRIQLAQWLTQITLGLVVTSAYCITVAPWPIYLPVAVEFTCLWLLCATKFIQDTFCCECCPSTQKGEEKEDE